MDWNKAKEILIGDYHLAGETRRLAALLCLVIAAAIGCVSFTTRAWFGDPVFSLRPDLQSGFFALFLIGPLYVRGITPWTGLNVFSMLSLVLNWSITASLANAALGDNSGLVKFLPIDVTVVLVGAVLLGWLGMRPLAGLSWAVFFLFGALNISAASDAMGIWGFAFLLSAFFGVLLQADLNPRHLFAELHEEFSGHIHQSKDIVSVGSAYKTQTINTERTIEALPDRKDECTKV